MPNQKKTGPSSQLLVELKLTKDRTRLEIVGGQLASLATTYFLAHDYRTCDRVRYAAWNLDHPKTKKFQPYN
jgi:hypothetical protein